MQRIIGLLVGLISLIFIATGAGTSSALTLNQSNSGGFVSQPGPRIVVVAAPYKGPIRIPPPQRELSPNAAQAVTINVTYNGFSAQAQAAFQAAVDIWAPLITLPSTPPNTIEVEANWVPLGSNVLGSAGAKAYWTNGGIPAGIFYPDALADAIVGFDINPIYGDTEPYEIVANFNSSYSNWYLGTDGLPGAGEFDFVTVVMHELGHGLGFAGSATVVGSSGSINTTPYIYDCFTADGNNLNLITAYANPSTALGNVLTGDDIHFGGPGAVAGSVSGTRNAKLYAPTAWDQGSSYSHLDDATYDGTVNALMTHALGMGEAVHDPGPITMGLLTDLGWNGGAIPPTGGCPSIPTAVTLQGVGARSQDGLGMLGAFGLLGLVSLGFWQAMRRRVAEGGR